MDDILKNDSVEVLPEEITTEDTWKVWVATPFVDPEAGMSEFNPNDIAARNALSSSFDVATTEWNWNGWFAGTFGNRNLTQPDLAKGFGSAGFLHALMRRGYKIKLVCQSMLVKSHGASPPSGPILNINRTGSVFHQDKLPDCIPIIMEISFWMWIVRIYRLTANP